MKYDKSSTRIPANGIYAESECDKTWIFRLGATSTSEGEKSEISAKMV